MIERIDPNTAKTELSFIMALRHIAVYNFVQSFVKNYSTVLDLGCGVGYGSYILSKFAEFVTGLDPAFDALTSNSNKQNDNIVLFVNGLAETLPFPDASFEMVVSLQVIEHINDQHQYLTEITRVLTNDGLLIVSTPNRVLRLLPFQSPTNPYHVREYDYKTLKKLVVQYFTHIDIKGLHATGNLMLLEHQRLKQNPFKVYSQMVLPGFVINTLKLFLSSNQNLIDVTSSTNNYTLNDFWVNSYQVTKSLDLIAICRK